MKPTLEDIKRRLRKTKWGFLAEILGETEYDRPTMGVNGRGVLLVNPVHASRLSTVRLGELCRHEVMVANGLRDGVPHFR